MQSNLFKKLSKLSLIANPLKDLTLPQIEQLFQQSKAGNDTRLQLAYDEMEKVCPIFNICKTRRISKIIERGWEILPLNDNPNSIQQAKSLQAMLSQSENNVYTSFTDAIMKLAEYSFKGRSIIKPFIHNGNIQFQHIKNANIISTPDNEFYWHEDVYNINNSKQINPNELIYLKSPSPIYYPGLIIYLRQLVGETQWARFIEKQGIPQVVITAPDGTTDSQYAQFTQRAAALYEGGSGVLPNGSTVNVLDSARGQDPFSNFISHQDEIIAILSLGSTAAIFPQNSGLGSDLNSTQAKILNSIVGNDCRLIQNAFNKFFNYIGYENCQFKFNALKNYSTKEILEISQALRNLDIKVDQNKIKQLIDIDIVADDDVQQDEVWQPEEDK